MSNFVFALLCFFAAANASELDKLVKPERGLLEHPVHSLRQYATAGIVQPFLKQDGSGLHMTTRRLLQRGSCTWSSEDDACSISGAAVFELILESDSPTAEIFTDQDTCASKTTKRRCESIGSCYWDGNRCGFHDYSNGNDNSPCVQHAPATIAYYAAIQECPTETTRSSCERVEGCTWDEASGSCGSDFSQIFFGLDDASGRSDEALLSLVDADGDRDFIETLIDCLGRTSESECTGTCSWSAASGRCTVGIAAVIHAITVNSGGSTDPVCSYFSMLEDSGCYTISTSAECRANDDCEYDNGCGVNAGFLVVRIAEEDSEFARGFVEKSDECRSISTESRCF